MINNLYKKKIQQDSSSAYCGHETTKLPRRLYSVDTWHPKSPDLNRDDYQIQAIKKEHVYQTDIHSTDELKQRPIQFWCNPGHNITNVATD